MKERTKRVARRFVTVMLAAAMAVSVTPAIRTEAKSKAPTISSKSITLIEGDSKTLTVKKGTYKIKSIRWSTSKKKVATVSSKGKVKAVAPGTAKIKAKVKVKKSKKKTKKYTLRCKVKVKKAEVTPEPYDDTGVWYTAEEPVIDEHSALIFEKLAQAYEKSAYTPVVKLAYRKVEEGQEFRYYVKDAGAATDKTRHVIMDVLEAADESVSISKLYQMPDLTGASAPDSWKPCESVVMTDEEKVLYLGELAWEDGVSCRALARIGTQEVKDGNLNLIIIEKHVVVPDAEKGYVMAEILVKPDGTATAEFFAEVDMDQVIDPPKTSA